MPRGPGFPASVVAHAVTEYLAGRATMPVIARELGVTTATISRWVAKARAKGVQLRPPSVITGQAGLAARVAELAPPPAPPSREPGPDVSTGDPKALMARAAQMIERLIESSERARAQGDPRVEATTISAIVKTLTEIRQLQADVAKAGGSGLAITRDDVDAAALEIRRRLDEIAAAKGETLMWTLDGTPDVSAAPTRNTVTGDAPADPLRRA